MASPPSFLPADQSFLLSSFHAGIDCMSMQLREVAPGPANIAFRLFGDGDASQKRAELFPAFAALELRTKAFSEPCASKDVTDALVADVTALFVRARAIASAGVVLHDEFWARPVPLERVARHHKVELDAVTTRCTDFYRRVEITRHATERLARVCDDVMSFTQLAARFGIEVPAAVV